MYSPRPRRTSPNRNQGTGNINRPRRPRRRSVVVGTAKPGVSGGGTGFHVGPTAPPAGTAPRPAAPAPAPKPAPTPQNFTPDAAYNDEVDLAHRSTEHTLSGLRDEERRTKFDFGIDDPTNPNSRMAGLKRAFLARGKSASVGLAAQGHLYSGAHERAGTRVRRDQEFATADLRRVYEDAIRGIGERRSSATFAEEGAKNTAFQNWLDRHADDATEEIGAEEPAAAESPAPKAGESPAAAALRANRRTARAARRAARRARAHPRPKPTAHPQGNRRQGSGSTHRRRH